MNGGTEMDVREKLAELLTEFYGCDPMYYDVDALAIAQYLITHGVTVQEWIPVDDRLPDDDEVVIICTDKNFVYAGELIGDTWFLDNDSWTATVTHWMPLPKPPKGE